MSHSSTGAVLGIDPARRIRFQPANASMEPIYVHRRDFRETMIIGRVVGVYRRM